EGAQRASRGAPAAGAEARNARWRIGAAGATGVVCPEPRLYSFSWKLLSRSASNMTTWVNSQFPRPDFHRQVQRHYGLQNTGFPQNDELTPDFTVFSRSES